MTQRRNNQIEVGLERIEDPATREAFENLLRYVQGIAGGGISSFGRLDCESLVFAGESTPIKVRVFEGELDDSTGSKYEVHHKVEGRVLGACGMFFLSGSLNSIGSGPLPASPSGSEFVRWFPTAYDSVAVRNFNNANDSTYSLVVFYKKESRA